MFNQILFTWFLAEIMLHLSLSVPVPVPVPGACACACACDRSSLCREGKENSVGGLEHFVVLYIWKRAQIRLEVFFGL